MAAVIRAVWPMSVSSSKPATTAAAVEAEWRSRTPGTLAFSGLGEHPGDQDQQGWLHELGRLQGEAGRNSTQRVAPLALWPRNGRANIARRAPK